MVLVNDFLYGEKYKDMKKAVVVGVSGGKDSAATALLFNDKYPEFNKEDVYYVFMDTGEELPETYDFLICIEKYINKSIIRLHSKAGSLGKIIESFNGYLPSAKQRYCTKMSKIFPFRDFLNSLNSKYDAILSLVGLRSDEDERTGYEPCGKYAIKVVQSFPLKEEGMTENDVFEYVESRIGLPKYYEWRTRSGCYFCFFQRRIEWIGLMERHYDLFQKAKDYEKNGFTWIKEISLTELEERVAKIKKRYRRKLQKIMYENNEKQLIMSDQLTFTDAKIFERLMKEDEDDCKNDLGCSTCR